MINSEKYVYPAFIQQEDEGMFCVYFPTLFPEAGWDYPLSRGETKRIAIKNARKDLAFSLAGILYDNEDLPEPIPIQSDRLSKGMELIDVETSFEPYADELQEHLKGRHWHIGYYVEENGEYIEAIGFKNDQGMWDIFFEDYSEEEEFKSDNSSYRNPQYQDTALLFTVKFHSEAEEKFNQFVEDVILKRRGYKSKKD
jgi:predicted RNase H-like HicB family nuclease